MRRVQRRFESPDEVQFRTKGDRLVPYIDFLAGSSTLPVEGIIIGPGWQLRQLEKGQIPLHHVHIGLSRLLEARGLPNVPVDVSQIPFDPR